MKQQGQQNSKAIAIIQVYLMQIRIPTELGTENDSSFGLISSLNHFLRKTSRDFGLD